MTTAYAPIVRFEVFDGIYVDFIVDPNVFRSTSQRVTPDATTLLSEAFDESGGLILQIFGYRKDVNPAAWEALCAGLPTREEVTA